MAYRMTMVITITLVIIWVPVAVSANAWVLLNISPARRVGEIGTRLAEPWHQHPVVITRRATGIVVRVASPLAA